MSEQIDRALSRWAGAAVDASRRHATAVVLAGLALTLLSGALAATHLAVDTDPDRMTSPELPFRMTKKSLERAFPMLRDNLVLVVEADQPEDARAAAREMAGRLRADPDRFRSVFAPGADGAEDPGALLYLSMAAFRSTVASIAAGEAPGPSGRGAGPARELVLVQPTSDYTALEPALEAIDAIRREAATLAPRSGQTVRITGDLAVLTEEMSEIRTQVFLASLVSLLLVTAVLLYTLRSFRLFLATALLLLVGLSWTAGFAALAVGHLNVLTTAFAVLYIGLGVDFGIHFALGFRERRDRGDPPDRALLAAGRDVGSSLFFCALTTATGFFAFIPTDYTAVAELGLISGTGMFLSLLATLTWYPATLALGLGASDRLGAQHRQKGWRLPSFPLRRPGLVIGVAALLALGGGVLAPGVRFDDNPLNVRDPRVESVRAMKSLLADGQASPWTIEILAPDASEARRVARQLEALPEVSHVRTVFDLLPADQEAKLALLADLPQSVAAQLELPRRPLRLEDLPAALRERYLAPDGQARVEVFAKEDLTRPGALARFADAVLARHPDAAGAAIGTVAFARAIVDALRRALATSIAVITILLLCLWRSPRAAALTLAPLLLGSLCLGAFTVLIDLPFNFANVIVLPLLLGIGVDSGIHLVHRHRLKLRADRHLLDTSTARAVLVSALTTLLSFATLSLASHGGIASLALLLVVGVAWMMLGNLFLLPALLVRFGR